MNKGSKGLTLALVKRGGDVRNLSAWAAKRYGGCETSWRKWIGDPATMKVAVIRQLKLNDEEMKEII